MRYTTTRDRLERVFYKPSFANIAFFQSSNILSRPLFRGFFSSTQASVDADEEQKKVRKIASRCMTYTVELMKAGQTP